MWLGIGSEHCRAPGLVWGSRRQRKIEPECTMKKSTNKILKSQRENKQNIE